MSIVSHNEQVDKMIENNESGVSKERAKNNNIRTPNRESAWLKSVRLTINLLMHVLICFTVYLCVFFSFYFDEVTLYHWHIVLCVLGFQFFMCQGIMVMSPYNSWSMFLSRRTKKHIHWVMQVIAAILVTVGTVFVYLVRPTHFTTVHGKTGLWALVFCLASMLNGLVAMYPNKLAPCFSVFWMRFFHYVSGLASTFLGTWSLCAAYDYEFFREWTGNEVFVPILFFITWLFTVLVSLDFWIVLGYKISNYVKNKM